MFGFNGLSDIQRRMLVDLRQAYDALGESRRRADRHFAGSMRWRERNGAEYLFRKIGTAERSLGRRSPSTEEAYTAFMEGRERIRERLAAQSKALDVQAALARTAGLGRVPRIVAQLLRKLDGAHVLGHIRVVGTNALYAYEALAGVTIGGDALATGDIDLLLDARRRLRIMVPDGSGRSIVGLAKRVDSSFETIPGKPYRMINDDGFMLDLIRPQPNPAWKEEPGSTLEPGDLTPAMVEGLQWLVNAPSAETLVTDVNGYPAPIVAPEPRVWMAHKMWLSQRPLRDPVKARRDAGQARLVRDMIVGTLPQYPLDDSFFSGLPGPLRTAAEPLKPIRPAENRPEDDFPQPNW